MILSKILGGSSSLSRILGPWKVSEVPGEIYGGPQSAAGVRVAPQDSLSLSAIFAGVNLLSRIIGSLPLPIYRQEGRNREQARDASAFGLLNTQANEDMTAATARRMLEFYRLLWGMAYAEIGWRGDGQPGAIWPIAPWRVWPKRENGQLYYLVDGRRRVAPADMIAVPLISFDGICGVSFVDFACESLGLNIGAQEFAARFFGNGANPGGILSNDAAPSEQQRAEVRESWVKHHQGPRKAHSVGVLWGGWKYEADKGAVNPEKAQLLETRRFGVEEVSRWLNIPPHLLRHLADASNNNIEHQGIDFVVYTLMPVLTDYEQEFDRKLLKPGLYSKHNVSALLKGDKKASADFYREMNSIGVFSINDILEMEDRNPITDGDVHFVPMNMAPLSEAVKPKPAPTPSAPLPGSPPGNPPPQSRRDSRMGLLTHTLARLAKVEANELRRAVKKPAELFTWMDDFHPKLNGMLVENLMPVVPLLEIAQGPSEIAHQWVQCSRRQVLAASDGDASGFPARVEDLLGQWEMRPREVAGTILGE